MGGKRAIVFGASGVTGWSFINEILHDYPQTGLWEGVVAMTNRSLKQEDSLWPADPRLQIVSGVNLLDSQDTIEAKLKDNVQHVGDITHVFYLAYKANADLQQEYEDAVSMFKRAIIAMDHLSPALEFCVLQTGAKMYGCHLLENHPTDYIHVPLREDMPRLKAPYGDMLFYHPQLDWIAEYSQGRKWSWIDTRPDIIIGFVPNQNAYSLAQSLGIFLSLYAHVEGRGAQVSFPGTTKSWNAKSIDSSSDMIARQTLHLSLTLPSSAKGEGFNVGDSKDYSTWSVKWPRLCAYFGLEGTAPPADTSSQLEVRQYIIDHLDEWKVLEQRYSLKSGVADSDLTFKGFEYFLLTQFDFDRQYNMSKMYSSPKENPFTEQRDTKEAWYGVFDRMRAGHLIPKDARKDSKA
ncbi:Short chain dehydrogenase sirQ [Pseudocercospora fuligena]|uniref:Short chain dehydrogenase sirQ n=1 Tax=Pseudocercospora fuligena TaxID=685502 RepID=A0A8H6R717_9PEZI|nr:Short chain dehydrogenase sirQ [Pseudocercospora fuligena]